MTAQIGYDGLDLRGDPRPELLIDVARVQPEPAGDWVHLGRLGFRSTQRLWIGDVPGGVAVATWPAELKPQACYLYGGGHGSALVAAAIERGWEVEPSPHIAFRTASSARRLYMCPRSVEPLEYIACWEDEDGLSRVGGNYARGAVERELWPWLKQRGFADDGDDAVLRRFLDEFLGNWPANMRPGLRFFRVWAPAEAAELGSALAETIRSQFDAVFVVAHEPALQTARPDLDALPPSTGNRPAGKPRPVQRPDPLTCTLTGGIRGDSLTHNGVDAATEILTTRGWLPHDRVAAGDTALTLDAGIGTAEWQPVQSVYVLRDGPYPVVKMESLRHSSVTTPDHRWPVMFTHQSTEVPTRTTREK